MTAAGRRGDHPQPSPVWRSHGKLLDVSGAADYLGTTDRFIRRLVAERRVPFHKVGRHVRFAVADLDAFLAAGRVEPNGAA